MNIKKIAGALGAEISGVDLTQTLSPDLTKEIRDVFLKNSVIFLRHQPLTSQQFMNFAKAMGEPVEYPFIKGFEDFQ
jgi:taurine dioxygenase